MTDDKKIDPKILDLHERTSKISADDLLKLIHQLTMQGNFEGQLKVIFKMYLFRALYKEGVR